MSLAYLEAMRASYRAVLQSGAEEHQATLAVDGSLIRLRFAGADMAQTTLPALGPLITEEPAEPTFTVELWDSATVGNPPPRAPWRPADAGQLGAVKGYNEGTARAVVDQASRTITVCDLALGRAVVWAQSAAELPGWWRAMPLRVLLGWVLARPGRHVVHAGAVGAEGRGLLLAGSGGAGKSTLAVSCLEAGMDYVGDDYVLLSSHPHPQAHALYGTAKLDAWSLARVPELANLAHGQAGRLMDDDKLVLNLSALRPAGMAPSTTIQAIVVPRREAGLQSSIAPLSRGAALRALAPSTIFQAPGGAEPALRVLRAVAASVPCYELILGRKASVAPKLLRSALAEEL